MFVLLFGLMGVAAIFPVGNHYVIEGEKFDLGAALAQNAFEELKGRGMLRPEVWYYAEHRNLTSIGRPVVDPTTSEFTLPIPTQAQPNAADGPGHAFVLDPIGGSETSVLAVDRRLFPAGQNNGNPWINGRIEQLNLPGNIWPIRRVTLPVPDPSGNSLAIAMTSPVAETIFRLRDDLAVEQPDKSDVPSIQRWDLADVDLNGDPNDTLKDVSDDQLMRRQYKGDYSWFATIVPKTRSSLEALQPADSRYGNADYDVSVVVFRKRTGAGAETERQTHAELLLGGELVIYTNVTTNPKDEIDEAVEDIRSGNWISLAGVNQTTGDFILNWYRILSMDDETTQIEVNTESGGMRWGRRMMVDGPDWPATPNPARPGEYLSFIGNLRVGLFPGAISVVTKPLRMESSSLWDVE